MAGLSLGKSMITVGEEAIKGAGRTRLLNWYTLTETTLAVVLLLVLIRPFGLVGVGLSISLTAMVVGVVVAALAGPVVGVTMRQTFGATAPAITSALVGCAVVAPLEHLVLHSDRWGLWGLGSILVDGVVFLLVYAAALRVIAPATFKDVVSVVTSLWHRALPGRGSSRDGAPDARGPARSG
jgi:O-antigen/teichoic acid export membrane protein